MSTPSRPEWWTADDEADARSVALPETPEFTIDPPDPDAPQSEWDAFNAEVEAFDRAVYDHHKANHQRWRCRTCAFWDSNDGVTGRCESAELDWRVETSADDNVDCIAFWSR